MIEKLFSVCIANVGVGQTQLYLRSFTAVQDPVLLTVLRLKSLDGITARVVGATSGLQVGKAIRNAP